MQKDDAAAAEALVTVLRLRPDFSLTFVSGNTPLTGEVAERVIEGLRGRGSGIMTATRRLAAILAADVAGYSRLVGADEEGTLNRLRSIRAELIDPKITEHRGRVVKTTGDGLLVEFASVVDGLRCASEWQRGMAERNADVPPTSRIEFRIGVHQGDIVVDALLLRRLL
jgi:class 3 adenylate cyclase